MESNVIIAFFSWDFHHCLWIIRFSEKKGDFIGIFLTLSQGYVKIVCVTDGEVSERFKELVLKTSDSKEPRVRIPSSPPFSILAAKKNIGLGYHLEMYSSWWRGAPAKGVGWETGARVRVSPSPPNHCDKIDVQAFCPVKSKVCGLFRRNSGKPVCRRCPNRNPPKRSFHLIFQAGNSAFLRLPPFFPVVGTVKVSGRYIDRLTKAPIGSISSSQDTRG